MLPPRVAAMEVMPEPTGKSTTGGPVMETCCEVTVLEPPSLSVADTVMVKVPGLPKEWERISGDAVPAGMD